MSVVGAKPSAISDPIAVNTSSLLDIKRAFDAAFGRSSDNPDFQRMINAFPFHQVIQPGKGLLMKLFMLEALGVPEEEKRAAYVEIRQAFDQILKGLVYAKGILKLEPVTIRPAGAEPATPEEHERRTAEHVVACASALSAALPPGSQYEDLRAIMLPLVKSFKAALHKNKGPLGEVLKADFAGHPVAVEPVAGLALVG
jgi:hypothetical protein